MFKKPGIKQLGLIYMIISPLSAVANDCVCADFWKNNKAGVEFPNDFPQEADVGFGGDCKNKLLLGYPVTHKDSYEQPLNGSSPSLESPKPFNKETKNAIGVNASQGKIECIALGFISLRSGGPQRVEFKVEDHSKGFNDCVNYLNASLNTNFCKNK